MFSLHGNTKNIVEIKYRQKNKFFTFNLFLVFFLAFGGYYVGLMMVSNFASINISRYYTIPARLTILIGMYFLCNQSKQIQRNFGFFAFIIFSTFYLTRIAYELVFNVDEYYMPKFEFFLYFVSFVLAPFMLISQTNFSRNERQSIFRYILLSFLVLSIFSYYFYGELLGKVTRISQEITRDENFISPLALSYCGSLGIGLGISFLLTNNVNIICKTTILIIIMACFVPFFLGASRGSVLALLVPFILYLFYSKGKFRKIQLLIYIGIGIISMIYVTRFFGTGVFDRFSGIGEAISSDSSSASRLDIWIADLNQFTRNPFFGNSLESEMIQLYSHNILIEILITTGVFGFIPFISFIWFTFKKSVNIIKYSPEYFWLTVIFYQAFMQYMFSGAIWGMSWIAIGASLIIGFTKTQNSNS